MTLSIHLPLQFSEWHFALQPQFSGGLRKLTNFHFVQLYLAIRLEMTIYQSCNTTYTLHFTNFFPRTFRYISICLLGKKRMLYTFTMSSSNRATTTYITHYMDMPQLVYPFFCCWTLVLFPGIVYYKWSCYKHSTTRLLWTCIFIGHIWMPKRWMSHMISARLLF